MLITKVIRIHPQGDMNSLPVQVSQKSIVVFKFHLKPQMCSLPHGEKRSWGHQNHLAAWFGNHECLIQNLMALIPVIVEIFQFKPKQWIKNNVPAWLKKVSTNHVTASTVCDFGPFSSKGWPIVFQHNCYYIITISSAVSMDGHPQWFNCGSPFQANGSVLTSS